MQRKNLWPLILLGGVAVFYLAKALYMQPRFDSGEPAPALQGTTLAGKPFSLQQLHGRFVLVDFWGSWCGPCRAESPALVQLYRELGGEDFTIVSVGIERDSSRWRNAIARDGRAWPLQLMDPTGSLRFFDGALARAWGIRQVPSSYLIDPHGRIVAHNPDPATIEEAVANRR